MIKVYLIGLGTKDTRGNGQWDGIVEEIKNINPDKILCIGNEEGWPCFWFDNDLLDKLWPWLEEQNKVINLIGGFPDQIDNYYHPRVQAKIIHEESVGCLFWNPGSLYEHQRESVELDKTTKLFTCYNRSHKLHRVIMIDELVRYNLLNDGVVTMHDPDLYVNEGGRLYFKTPGSKYVWKYHDGSILIDEENFSLPCRHGTNLIPKSYNQGFFDLITETCYEPNQFLITEKTLRAIGMTKPFIVLSCKGYHAYLRDKFGFEFYDEMFDYSFDQCDRLEDRINGIIHNVLRLKNILTSETEKANLYNVLKPKLNRNLERREDVTWDTDIVIPNSMRFLLEDTNCKVYGERNIAMVDRINEILNKNGHSLNWAEI
jgi:hypothetical protein